MKYRTTQKEVNAGYYNRICIGYCDLQYLLTGIEPVAYTCGIYGWNADIYQLDDSTAIVTGYRPFGNIHADYDYNRKMEEKARKIFNDYSVKYQTRLNRIAKLRAQLISHYTQEV